MAFNQNLDVFFNVDEFAVQALYEAGEPAVGEEEPIGEEEEPVGGSSKTITVIFDHAFIPVTAEEGTVALEHLQAIAKQSDIPHAKRGEVLTIGGRPYYIMEVQPDGAGLVTLILSMDL